MTSLTKDNYENSVSSGAVMVKVGADWCGDCRRIDPILDALEKDYAGKITFFDVNFSEQEELKDLLNIRRIPTLIFYKDGKEIGSRLIEPSSRVEIEKSLEGIL